MVTQPTPHQWSGHAKEFNKRYIYIYICIYICMRAHVNRIRNPPLLRNLKKYNIPSSIDLLLCENPHIVMTIDNSVKQIDF